jgi:hypothetical protein
MLIAVHDEGPGIALEFLPDAAERLRQDETLRTGVGPGVSSKLSRSPTEANCAAALRVSVLPVMEGDR